MVRVYQFFRVNLRLSSENSTIDLVYSNNSKSNVDEYKLVVVEKNLLKLMQLCFKCGVLFIGEPKRIAGFYCFYVRYEAQCLSSEYKSKWETDRWQSEQH